MTHQLLTWFGYEHLPEGLPRDISANFHGFATAIDEHTAESSEKTAGLRKLLEAKDCIVRAAIITLMQQGAFDEAGPSEEEIKRLAAEELVKQGSLICPECLQGKHPNCTKTVPVGINDTLPCACVNGCGRR